MRLPFHAATGRVRDTLRLDGRFRPTRGQPTLYGFSRHVVPLPEDARHIVTGYWRLPPAGLPPLPDDLAAFLDHPQPTIGIGFGSMGSADPVALGAIVAGAARDAGVRAVILGDAIRVAPAPELFVAREAPHALLFPRLAAIVHHGGAGTTGAAFGAGRAQVVVPFAVDQPFWASRVVALGCGPAAISRRSLARPALAAAIARALESSTAARARAIGDALAEENGTRAAVAAIERWTAARAR